ncbi:ester cyclase [Streptomyces sp. ISL-100]|uniref:ester cyclase n=1 Tax=Streptomyces sp. ISL-100 TaxID=2819173 RepID=UPI001BE9786B|nr:ester cyclase [Streptomyces sp. ISL-100]MBT2396045.1 ester cyclase [Streptomyces sp. ISL-100]
MKFVQIIDYKTERSEDMNQLMDKWAEQTKGKRTATHNVIGKDRSEANHYVEIVEFPSYEEAMKNSHLPETDKTFQEMVALCDGMPSFTDLDVVRDEQLNKDTCRRFFLELCGTDDPAGFSEIFAADYRDHDVANEQDTQGVDGIRMEALGYRTAFPDFQFTIEDQVAEGDRVATRWSWRGTNTGEMRGMPATGNAVSNVGTTTFRFEDGKIKEGWWHWDVMGMMRQLGMVEPSS